MRQPTLKDVAEQAGVSYATADRILNNRGGVAAKSAKRVLQAIDELGYVRNVAAANLSQSKVYRFAFILPTGRNLFFQNMRSILEARIPKIKLKHTSIDIIDVPPFEHQKLGETLQSLIGQNYDGVALVGFDSIELREKLSALRENGTAVVTLVSDVQQNARDAYVGIDNKVAGQTAGKILGLSHGGQAGKVLPVLGSKNSRDHMERFEGFRQVLSEQFPNIELMTEVECLDQRELMGDRVRDALSNETHISAIYSIGAGNSALVELFENSPSQRPFIIVHELAPHSREALENNIFDVVIDQRPELEITSAIKLMRAHADRKPTTPIHITPEIFVRENLPAQTENEQP